MKKPLSDQLFSCFMRLAIAKEGSKKHKEYSDEMDVLEHQLKLELLAAPDDINIMSYEQLRLHRWQLFIARLETPKSDPKRAEYDAEFQKVDEMLNNWRKTKAQVLTKEV